MSLGAGPAAARLGEIAAAVGGAVVGSADLPITGVSSLEDAGPGELAFIDGERFVQAAHHSRAAAFVVAETVESLTRPQLVVADPRYAFVRVVERFFAAAPRSARGIAREISRGADVEIGPDASIWPFVTLGNRVRLGARVTLFPGVFLGDDVSVGDGSILYPSVTVLDRCTLGARVILHSGVVVGSDGFGYVPHDGRLHKIPQLGGVVIEDDVELGANVTVDRATFGRTVIRRGTKVDNLVQIAHNAVIGEHSVLAGQVGVSGSTRIGAHVMVGGQAGFADHVSVGNGARVAAQAGVFRDVPDGQAVAGSPALPHDVAGPIHGVLLRLPELRKQVRQLEQRVRELESQARPAAKPSRPRRPRG
jgi:UDP-3-O-[3-hydroxymyristoyl] glucosamine N-acyltransferase